MRAWRVLMTLALLASVAPSAAEAAITRSGGLKYVTKSFDLVPGKPRTHKAPCPKRNKVLGGGHYNSGGFGEVFGLHSYPYDDADRNKRPEDGWASQQRAFGEAQAALVYAICARISPEYVSEKETIPADEEAHKVTLECPVPTLNITSGGSRGAASVREVGGLVSAFGWEQNLANHGQNAREVTALAVCSTLDVDVALAQVVAEGGEQSLATAQCPAETPHVVAGGMYTNRSGEALGNTAVAATQPYEFTNAFDGWRSWMDNYNGDMDLTAIAICVAPL